MPFDVRPRDVVILSAVRTPFGTQGGTLKDITAQDLAAGLLELRERGLDGVICGRSIYTGALGGAAFALRAVA